jgi:hypothetical protein
MKAPPWFSDAAAAGTPSSTGLRCPFARYGLTPAPALAAVRTRNAQKYCVLRLNRSQQEMGEIGWPHLYKRLNQNSLLIYSRDHKRMNKK